MSEVDAEKVKVGQNVIASFPFGDRQIRAKVEQIAGQVDHETHTVQIWTTIPNPDGRLKPGMFVRMAVETDVRDDDKGAGGGAVPGLVDSNTRDRMSELERKIEKLLDEKEERTSHAKILERLEVLERKLDQILNGRRP